MAADKGHVDAMLSHGRGVPVNEKEASKYYKMAADKGQIAVMFNYGVMLREG